MPGWPEDVSDVPNALKPYHNHCDEMTAEDGLILKEEDPTQDPWRSPRDHQMPVQSMTLCLLARHQPTHQSTGTAATTNTPCKSLAVPGVDPGGGPGGPGPPLTTKNEAPAPKFYKTEAQEW